MFASTKAVDEYFENREKIGIKPGLDRMECLLKSVDHPEKSLTAVHVAGTNGKGSTVTYIASMLMEVGFKVGTFTSPSLTTHQAMIQMNHQPISDELYIRYVNQLLPSLKELDGAGNPASNFEIIVAVAFQFFNEHADISIIETGMGGRDDATNLLDPILSIITSIDLDHKAFLGDTIGEIASHKAGIIKPSKSVIVGKLPHEACEVIEKVTEEKNAPIYKLGSDFNVSWIENQPYYKDEEQVIPLQLKLLGEHQLINAALATKAILLLKENGYLIDTEQMKDGLSHAHLPARFEQIHDHPIIIIDGAHNQESIRAFIKAINKYYKNMPKRVLFAAFKDKPIAEMLEILESEVDEMVFTSFSHERAEQAEHLLDLSNHQNKKVALNWQNYLSDVKENGNDETVTFVVGSLDFVGKVRKFIE